MINTLQEAKDLLKEYDLSDHNEVEYEYIHEIADSNVDIYYNDIFNSVREVADCVEDARNEGLISGNETLTKQIQVGQYLHNERILREAWEELKK